ncbi:ketose-bisphosphate aldolase [symbiont of Argiope bruennichi]|uniref:ketose-bisphosphate aldolase n=1 Tax=symbiont of Argiope bruennichi TaxID=2810479 RepID=UPI003DA60A11
MLANLKKMLLKAQKYHYAVPAFNVHNLENIRACVNAAVKLRSPLILACTPSTFKFSGLEEIIAICSSYSKKYDIPIALHMDHHHTINQIAEGLDHGIRSVMIDASHFSLNKNIELTKEVVELSEKYDATVEAELGTISGVEDDLEVEHQEDAWITPEIVKDFVEKTEVDCLAVACGTAHGIYFKKPVLNVKLLEEVKKICNIPLVLHGGSGLTKEQIRSCIKAGVCKVNIGTELKAPYANSLKNFFASNPKNNDPRLFLDAAVKEIQKVCEEKILICMSNNRY